MSQENVEIVRRIYDAVASGDSASVFAAYDPDVEMDFSRSPLVRFLRKDVYRGHDGLRDFFAERYEEAWGTIEDVCEDLIDAGEGQVVSVVTSRGRGRVSGAPVQLQHAGLWTIRDDKVVRLAWFGSREDVLETAGLSE